MIKITIEKQAPAAGEHFPAAGAFVCLHFCTGSPLDHSAGSPLDHSAKGL